MVERCGGRAARIMSTVSGVFTGLGRRCTGQHEHAQTLGTGVLKRTALYTPELCRGIAKAILQANDIAGLGIFAVSEVKVDRTVLRTMTEGELERLTVTMLKLHGGVVIRDDGPSSKPSKLVVLTRGPWPWGTNYGALNAPRASSGAQPWRKRRSYMEHLADGCLPLSVRRDGTPFSGVPG